MVLSACPDTDAPLLLPEVPVQDVLYLVSFIYRGQVDVHQQHIASFLRTAKHLHVLGLEEGDRVGEELMCWNCDKKNMGQGFRDEDEREGWCVGNNAARRDKMFGMGMTERDRVGKWDSKISNLLCQCLIKHPPASSVKSKKPLVGKVNSHF